MSRVGVLAPAKLNLGLAVLGKRADGYHDVDTIMAMIDLYDEIEIREREEPGISIEGMDEVPPESNLITRAIELWSAATGKQPAYDIAVTKHIPSPGGLGGGSSDAAATLRALNALHGSPLDSNALHALACQLGADCPFFLDTPAAHATGTGTDLRAVSPPHGAVVVIVPEATIEAKTARLYGSLRPGDLADGEHINVIETALQQGRLLTGAQLANSFTLPVETLMPEVADIRARLAEVGIETTITGAGPGLYVIASDLAEAERIREAVVGIVSPGTFTQVASFLQAIPAPEIRP